MCPSKIKGLEAKITLDIPSNLGLNSDFSLQCSFKHQTRPNANAGNYHSPICLVTILLSRHIIPPPDLHYMRSCFSGNYTRQRNVTCIIREAIHSPLMYVHSNTLVFLAHLGDIPARRRDTIYKATKKEKKKVSVTYCYIRSNHQNGDSTLWAIAAAWNSSAVSLMC